MIDLTGYYYYYYYITIQDVDEKQNNLAYSPMLVFNHKFV
jgi:hypothetical protein